MGVDACITNLLVKEFLLLYLLGNKPFHWVFNCIGSYTIVTYLFIFFLFTCLCFSLHSWPCWQSNVWIRIPSCGLTWSKWWYPCLRFSCPLWSGKQLLLGTAKYSVALSKEDSGGASFFSAPVLLLEVFFFSLFSLCPIYLYNYLCIVAQLSHWGGKIVYIILLFCLLPSFFIF